MYIKVEGENIYRMKGVVGLKGQECRYTIQGVHIIFNSLEGKPWGEEEPFKRMVFIGKNLDEDFIRRSLESCLY